jgi:hypothetical protein
VFFGNSGGGGNDGGDNSVGSGGDDGVSGGDGGVADRDFFKDFPRGGAFFEKGPFCEII